VNGKEFAMRCLPVFVLVFCAARIACATELGNHVPAKSDAHVLHNPVVDSREGGEDIASALPIAALPFTDTGATCDNVNDYDAICPYSGSTSPDVVYSYEVPEDLLLTVDLCGSGYDTKVYVLDESENVLACNDDAYFGPPCGVYVSKIEDAYLAGGQTIYIVIDGYGGDCGEYTVDVSSGPLPPPCVLECPTDSWPEGEPPLVDGYLDSWNGGCNSPEFGYPFQELWGWMGDGDAMTLCGVSGWYEFEGDAYRDTDWFFVWTDESNSGTLDCEIDAEQGTYFLWFATGDCVSGLPVTVHVENGCDPQVLTITDSPGALEWLWVGPDAFYPPPGFIGHEYRYTLHIEGLAEGVVATESATWSQLKGLFR
jgi:hypothetical protein